MAMTTHEHDVLMPFEALTYDVTREYQELHHVCATLVDTVHQHYVTYGLRWLMIGMPDAGKIYDAGLSRGSVDFQKLRELMDGTVYDAFYEVFRLSFHEGGEIADPSANIVFYTRCLLYLYKKVDYPCDNDAIHSTFSDFTSIERELRAPSYDWGSLDMGVRKDLRFSELEGYSPGLLSTLDRVAEILGHFKPFDYRDVVPRHGPGSVSDLKRGNDKYTFPHWPAKLQAVFPKEYYISSVADLVWSDTIVRDCKVGTRQGTIALSVRGTGLVTKMILDTQEPIARVITVPKTLKGPRLITVEPTSHQFIQQGLMKWMRANMHSILRKTINFTDQRPSRDAAQISSKVGDRATVDLSSASDRLTCWSVERAFRNFDLLVALNACRTANVVLMTPSGQQELTLKKFAGMGSAVTFPVQSFVYTMCAVAAILYTRGTEPTVRSVKRACESVRVFGDDIVVPVDAIQSLAEIFDALQLRINADKTHIGGKFRESCGMDAYDGIEVTPLYLSSLSIGKQPSQIAAWIEIANNAFSKGLWALAACLDSQIPKSIRDLTLVSYRATGALTLSSFSAYSGSTLLTLPVAGGSRRLNRDLCCWEYKALALSTKSTYAERGTSTDLLQFFLEKANSDPRNGSGDQSSFLEVRFKSKFDKKETSVEWQPGWLVRARSKLDTVWVAGS